MITSLFLLLIALNILDVALTVAIIRNGGEEMNPIVRGLMGAVGTKTALVALKIPLLALLWYILDKQHPLGVWLLMALNAWYLFVCYHNWRELCRI